MVGGELSTSHSALPLGLGDDEKSRELKHIRIYMGKHSDCGQLQAISGLTTGL